MSSGNGHRTWECGQSGNSRKMDVWKRTSKTTKEHQHRNVECERSSSRKFHTLENELARENIAIWGITETHWKDSGYLKTTNNTIYISGATQTGKNGVMISVDNKTVKSVKEYLPISDRLIKILLTAHPINIHILLAYMPTSDSTDEENNYGKIEEEISRILQKNILIVCGRF